MNVALARRALEAFGRSGSMRRVATGIDDTFRVRLVGDDDGALALRVGGTDPVRRTEAMEAEVAWLTALGDESAVVVPPVLAAPDGRRVVTVVDDDGLERAATLVRWLPGRKARWRFTARHAFGLGAATAGLHAHARGFALPEGAWAKTWDPPRLCGRAAVGDLVAVLGPSAGELVEAMEARLVSVFAELGDAGWGLVNGDLGPHNVVWDGGEAGLFDFNDLGWGYFTHDLARCARAIRWRAGGEALVDALLDGYRSVAPLPEGWDDHAASFEAAGELLLASYLAGKVAERGPETVDVMRRLVDRARRLAA